MISDHLPPKEIYPYICVYSDLIEDPAEIYGIAKCILNSEKNFLFFNYEWSHFGDYSSTRIPKDPGLDLSTVKKIAKETNDKALSNEIKLYETFVNTLDYVFNDYTLRYNIKLPSKSYLSHLDTGINIARYKVGFSIHDQYNMSDSKDGKSMDWHTDFVPQREESEDNFLVTCNIYINDDYTGGEIGFKIGEDIVTYKPKAGEVIVFPSGSPHFPIDKKYLHHALIANESNKYFSRNYIMYSNWK